MSDWKPKQGEMILVRDVDVQVWNQEPRQFIWRGDEQYFCIDPNDPNALTGWWYAKPIPKKKYIPFTFETFPFGMIWTRRNHQNTQERRLITEHDKHGVWARDEHIEWEEMLEELEIRLDDGTNWQVAGVEVEE